MSSPGPPNGGGLNPPDLDPDASETNSETTSSNITIPEEELENFYVPRHGRTFHTFPRSPYFLPADEQESTRLIRQHQMFQRVLAMDYEQLLVDILITGGNGDSVVLDLGCGPGSWVEEFSRRYPSAYFIGIDLVPMALQRLDNAQFECYDISAGGIRLKGGGADVIHARCLSFGYNNFRRLLREAHRVLSPGGLLLSIEIDWRLEHQSDFPHFHMQATREFLHWVAACAMMANGGVAWDPTWIPSWLADAGFDNIHPEVRDIPVGPWRGSPPMQELGGLVQTMCIEFVAAMRPALLSLPGAELTQVDDLVAEVTNELESGENTGWSIPVHIVTAFKG